MARGPGRRNNLSAVDVSSRSWIEPLPCAPPVTVSSLLSAASRSGRRSSWSEPIEHPELSMERVFYRSEPDVVVPAVFVAPPDTPAPYPVVSAPPGSSSTDVDVAPPWGVPLLQRGMSSLP